MSSPPSNPVSDWNQGRSPQQERWGSPITLAQTIASLGTILHNGGAVARVTTAGAVTGVIVAPGMFGGQILFIQNEAANSITMATAATSNVFGGTAFVIPASRSAILRWDAQTAAWYGLFSG